MPGEAGRESGLANGGMQGLARWTRGLLFAHAAVCLLAVGAALQFGPGFDDEDGSTAYLAVALVQFPLFLVTAILFLRWTYRANDTVHRLGAQGLGPSPGWAVGWYFVPVACLGMPFQAMRETWKASIDPQDWEIVRASPMLGWWWLCWLLGCFASLIALRLDMERDFEAAPRVAEMLTTASDLIFVPASLLLAAIVGRITALQNARLAS